MINKWFSSSYLSSKQLEKALKKQLTGSNALLSIPDHEQALVEHIAKQTALANVDNVSRTKAYLDFYLEFPEITWSLLAHFVSRNSGWAMTDLKGEFLPLLLSKQGCESFFHMLERGNWLIFQDAYPQLLLYKESKRRKRPLFHLLHFFGVSSFMNVCWGHFLKTNDSALLARALIINEQHYIEERVIQHPTYKENVLDSMNFHLQEWLHMTHILFPKKQVGDTTLTGAVVEDFGSLTSRIRFGIQLYQLLFQISEVRKQAELWANAQPHTGSRKDYWPHLFTTTKETLPGILTTPRLHHCQLKLGKERVYSPPLRQVWSWVSHPHPEREDWFVSERVIDTLFQNEPKTPSGSILSSYCNSLSKLELAVIAKKAIFLQS
ncbi:hypothetical protein N781_00580 [Pontibacillus halophilus JSM 076056 = DSM 19796]|uniref:DUF2515 domain-containing protein n=1 Tax=Pontibacillus halophilus JSM 076056 = DSM 19796 TaxID=1385510 RepID=A0A0A5GRD8_9BACI|nr:DUF2515 family protein [Pontibacillus halophilus]KGX93735.1 hypothetical protein N781_00580 [Pontibacillus halophilus JSM 076056 = DSM 19796]